MCNVSGLIIGIYKGYAWQAPLGELPYIYQICSSHLRSDLQSRISAFPSQPYSCTPLQYELRCFMQRLLYLVSLEEAFFGCHCLDVFTGEGNTGRCFSSSLSNQSFPFIMSASFPISQPSFRPIKLQKPFVQGFICCEATSCLCLATCTILCGGIEQKREGRTQCFL